MPIWAVSPHRPQSSGKESGALCIVILTLRCEVCYAVASTSDLLGEETGRCWRTGAPEPEDAFVLMNGKRIALRESTSCTKIKRLEQRQEQQDVVRTNREVQRKALCFCAPPSRNDSDSPCSQERQALWLPGDFLFFLSSMYAAIR